MPSEKYRGRGSIPRLTDPPQSATTEMPLLGALSGAKIPSTGPFVPGRSRFPSPGGGGTPPGFEFGQDSSEALLRSIATHLVRGDVPGLGRVLINAESARQIAFESRRGDREDFWSTVWRAIPGLPLAVDRSRFVNFMMGQGSDAKTGVDQLVAGQSKPATAAADATTGP